MLAGGAILTVSSRQHLATPDMHANEVLAAGTIMHKIVPLRGFLTEAEGFCHTADCPGVSPQGHRRNPRGHAVARCYGSGCKIAGNSKNYVTLSVRVFPLGGNTRVTRRVCYLHP